MIPRLSRALSLRDLLLLALAAPLLAGSVLAFLPALSAESSQQIFFDLLDAPGIVSSALLSLSAALATAAASLSIVLLFLAATQGNRVGRVVAKLTAPILAVPHAAAALGLALLLAPSGFLSRGIALIAGWDTPPDYLFVNHPNGAALILGLIVKEAPFLLLVCLAALPNLDAPRRVALARSLGYAPAKAWLLTVTPALYRQIRLPLFAVLVFASSTVDVALVLGPSLPPTLSVRILDWFTAPTLGARELAAAAAMLQLAVSLISLAIWIGVETLARTLYLYAIRRGAPQRIHHSHYTNLTLNGLGRMLLPTALLVTGGGLLALGVASIAGDWRYPLVLPADWTAGHWIAAQQNLFVPARNALTIALGAVVAGMVITLLLLESQNRQKRHDGRLIWLLYLPLLIPQVVFLSGMVFMAEWLGLSPSVFLVACGHLLFVLPYLYLTLSGAYANLDPRWEALAATLGASRSRRFWRVRLPLLSVPLITAAMLGLVISLGLYLPTQLLGAGRVPTLTTEAIALVSAGSRGAVGTWALLQSALPTLCFMLALLAPSLFWKRRKGMTRGIQ
jgi:putative thiamine transport system permease protein